MDNWTQQFLKKLLRQINEVPFTDEREEKQLAILAQGVYDIQAELMSRASLAAKQKMVMSSVSDVESLGYSDNSQGMIDMDDPIEYDEENIEEELDQVEKTLIRSIDN